MSMEYTVTLHNGVLMPIVGLGVWQVSDSEAEQAVKAALQLGYRSIDTAKVYDNEVGVGKGIAASNIKREDIFLTSKVWNSDQGYESTLKAFEASLERLQVDYLDLYLIHWPVAGKFIDTWRALETLYKEKKVRAIGVSNFQTHHLDTLLETAEIVPMVNQVEFHPYLTQNELRAYCKQRSIQVEAWSPLMQGNFLKEPVIIDLAKKYNCTPAQVVLRWDVQHHVVTIPKSVSPSRMRENKDIFFFELEAEDMERLNQLNKNYRFGADPDNFDF
jgi:diketogulonate reductase-like aldo/keto reductase